MATPILTVHSLSRRPRDAGVSDSMNGDTAARAAAHAPTPDPAPTSLPYIRQGTAEFRRASLALFASGFATFGLLYCVQPLLPEFSKDFGVGAAGSALALMPQR